MYKSLIAWYRLHKRDLPWRKTQNPYHILVSEMMLQQTQVSRGLVFYARWLTQFPDWISLAKASREEVIAAWSGLGYNRRAVMLHQIAKVVVDVGVPTSEASWSQLKGIGRYTAAAVSLFSGQQIAYPIDTNIRRVVSRVLLAKPYPNLEDDEEIDQKLRALLKGKRNVADFFQALFDFANASCLKVPLCVTCPLAAECKSAALFLSGKVEVPKAMIKKGRENKHRDKPHPDRIYRGRILKLIQKKKSLLVQEMGTQIDETYDATLDLVWVKNMLERMQKDGLIREESSGWVISDT